MTRDLTHTGRMLTTRSSQLRPLGLLGSATFSPQDLSHPITSIDLLRAFRHDTSEDDLRGRLQTLIAPPSPSSLPVAFQANGSGGQSLAEQLFDATASVKILTSSVAMHFEKEWRDRLFSQIDRLHDPEEWDEGDRPVQTASFATFLKAVCDLKPIVRPGLGLANGGLLVATWVNGQNRLTLQFGPNDRVKWAITRYISEDLERVVGETSVSRLKQALEPYAPSNWLERSVS